VGSGCQFKVEAMTIAFMEKQLYFILLPGSGAEPLEIPQSNHLLQNPLPRLIQP
jgi:hypothetical protein